MDAVARTLCVASCSGATVGRASQRCRGAAFRCSAQAAGPEAVAEKPAKKGVRGQAAEGSPSRARGPLVVLPEAGQTAVLQAVAAPRPRRKAVEPLLAAAAAVEDAPAVDGFAGMGMGTGRTRGGRRKLLLPPAAASTDVVPELIVPPPRRVRRKTEDGAVPPQKTSSAGAGGGVNWHSFVDWQLMGHEHEALPDAVWDELLRSVNGLKPEWRPMTSYLYSLGMRAKDFSRLLEGDNSTFNNNIFSGNVGRARSRIAFMQENLGLSNEDIVHVIETAPRILFLRIERTMQKRLAFLESLGVGEADMGKIVTRVPNLLYIGVEEVLEPRVKYLQYVLGLTREEVGRMQMRHPKLLTNSEQMVEQRLAFLFGLGLSDAAVKKIVQSHPQVLNYAPDSMQPRIKFLMDEVGMDEHEVADVVTKLSQLFSLSVDNSLRPKYEYLTEELGGGKRSLVSFPTYLTLSLEQRIQPRHRFLVELKQAENPFKLSQLLLKDDVFARRAGTGLAAYQAFKDSRAWADAR